jgi:hypothetical protein
LDVGGSNFDCGTLIVDDVQVKKRREDPARERERDRKRSGRQRRKGEARWN